MTHFVTLWLSEHDSDEEKMNYESILNDTIIKYCGGITTQSKYSSGGRRITAIPLCESQECNLPKGTIDKITEEIKRLTGRTSRGKVPCNLNYENNA